MTTNKTAKLLNSMKQGNSFSIPQIRSRFGFASETAVTGVLARLRNAGQPVYATGRTRDGRNKYSYAA